MQFPRMKIMGAIVEDLATLLQHIRPVVPNIQKAEWKAQLALSPKHGMPSIVEPRPSLQQ